MSLSSPLTNRFKMVEYADASPEVKSIYAETMTELGGPFVLNWFKCQGSNPVLLRGNWAKLRATMLLGDVPFVLKQLIIYNISKAKGCQYCTQAHGAIADSLSESLTRDPGLRLTQHMDSDFIPASYKVAISVVTKAALEPKGLRDEHFEQLREEGYGEQEIIELMALADLTNMVNTIADISGIKIDNELMETR